MTTGGRYATPAAFRAALTARIKTAATDGPWTHQQLHRQVAYDRLLERLYLVDDGWILKGATALLARDLGVRASLDIDLYRKVAREIAEADLRRAAATELGDWFLFDTGLGTPISDDAVRIPVDATVGATLWTRFNVDLVGTNLQMTGQPEDVPPLVRGVIPDVEQRGYRAYPLVDHIADKIAATYQRYGATAMPSTRYRDLVDLVAMITGASVAATAQRAALESEFTRRHLDLPKTFDVPDQTLWRAGFAAEAKRSLLHTAHTLDDALDIVRPFVNPLLDDTATGTWHRDTCNWS